MNTPPNAPSATHNARAATANIRGGARPRPRFAAFCLLALSASVAITGTLLVLLSTGRVRPGLLPPQFGRLALLAAPARLSRPYGMAPVAWKAYLRACDRAGVHPNRIGQTIGNHPRSKGYHHLDGRWTGGLRTDYCAAVDIGIWSLSQQRIARFCVALSRQGFAPFYRHGAKWKDGEHIHAIYALLPMKPQLRGQVNEFLRVRRRHGLPRLKWEKKLRRMQRRWAQRGIARS